MMMQKFSLAISILLLSFFALARKPQGPTITTTKFGTRPVNLFYFDDSDTILFHDIDTGDVQSSYNAGKTWTVVEGPDGQMRHAAQMIQPHPYNNKTAIVLTAGKTQWITEDAAQSWRPFQVDGNVMPLGSLVFHGKNPNKAMLHVIVCELDLCERKTYYTIDRFRTLSHMINDARDCLWAVSTPTFGDGLDLAPEIENRIFCITPGPRSPHENIFLQSDHFFQDGSVTEVPLNGGRAISGALRVVGVQKFLLTAVKSKRTSELALYVSVDGGNWHRAEFESHKLEEDAYTVLESTSYSIQIDVSDSHEYGSAMGVLFTSNSNGTYFTRNTEHVNRNDMGTVDFEKIAGIDGVMLVNTVSNWKEFERAHGGAKRLVSAISFDDGRSFQNLTVDGKRLHLHSVTDLTNSGRVFSSPAPGLVMGTGNTGDYLKNYHDGDLYVSNDGGRTWRKALNHAHKYEFGDQGSLLVAIYDEGETDEISYSVNHGKDWETAKLEAKIRALELTTTADSTSLKFVLVGVSKHSEYHIISIDFSGLHERHCDANDFEEWPVRLDENGEPACLMGKKQFYRRRKADAHCFINEEFKDPVPTFEPCKCSEQDFECDFNFVRSLDGQTCEQARPLSVPPGVCKKPTDTYLGTSGFRLIPGNTCSRDGGKELDKKIERQCSADSNSPTRNGITVEKSIFSTDKYRSYFYLPRGESSSGDDETVIVLTDEQEVYISHDHGKNWKQILDGAIFVRFIPHRFFDDIVFFLTGSTTGLYTIDRGKTFHKFTVPVPPNRDNLPPMVFHPHNKDWIIWLGADECDLPTGNCHTVAYYSLNRGAKWDLLMRYAQKCEFAPRDNRERGDQLVFCTQFENENPSSHHLQLLSSVDWFTKSTVHMKNILSFATMSEFIIVATKANQTLKVDASVDGLTFAEAKFPSNFIVPYQQAYTVLDSSTHAVFLHVTVSGAEDHEHGSIMKSNSNGTSYVLSLNAVNRNRNGFVDFEKMLSLEGVALANVVSNADELVTGGKKQLKTYITHNDGAQWALVPPPAKDSDGRDFGCNTDSGKVKDECSLNLHAFTERRDFRDTYSSPSAIGMMIALGNVGNQLEHRSEANTFLTRDGGVTWYEVRKGTYMWEFGDQGSIIVLVPESRPTKKLLYSLDEGNIWNEFQFTDVEMQIDDISTIPSDNSRNFLLWGKEVGPTSKAGFAVVNVDFTGLKERTNKCKFQVDKPEADDYYLWEPKHPLQSDNCLFGHVAQYRRKRPEAQCYNDESIHHLGPYSKNCECTRMDYEWYGF